MKKILITLLIVISNIAYSQKNFIWEKIDSTSKTKSEIYSLTKMFIAEKWKSAKDVIQNDDKDGGNILIKGIVVEYNTSAMFSMDYTYSYMVTFKMKDYKIFIGIKNVNCVRCIRAGKYEKPCIEPFDGDDCPSTGSFNGDGMSKKKTIEMMKNLKNDLQQIIDSYCKYINTNNNF